MESRTQRSKTNIIYTLVGFLLKTILTFVVQKALINVLGYEYLGINGLFSNILSLLSLAELGFGAAIVFSMYKPMAENDEEKLKSLLQLYKKIYFIVGIIVLLCGLILMPFLKFLINKETSIPNGISIYWVFAIFLFQSVSSYFLAYRRALLYTSQRNDIESKVGTITMLLLNSCKLAVLYLWPNYYLFLIVVALFQIIENVVIFVITKKMFPKIDNVNVKPLPDNDKKIIKKNVFALIYHKIGGVVVYSTDVLVIAKFLKGLEIVGKYTNYLLIITAITSLITLVLSAIKGSIGNLISKSTPQYTLDVFTKINFIYSWLIGFCSICLITLMNPFTLWWIDETALLPFNIVLLLVINFYFLWVKSLCGCFKECAGIFWQDRFKSVAESIINIVFSILLVKIIGLAGVIIGTIISTLSMPFWVEPKMLYKHYFKLPIKGYWLRLMLYTLTTIIIGFITWIVCSLIPNLSIWTLLAKFAICAILPNGLFVLTYFKTNTFKSCLSLKKELFKPKSKKES